MLAPHVSEFRPGAVGLARQKTESVARIAKDLRIIESCLRHGWPARTLAKAVGRA
jgi:hypothetical protein